MKVRHNDQDIEIRDWLPVIPLRDVVVFPHTVYPLLVGRKSSMQALQEAVDNDRLVLLLTQRSSAEENPARGDLFRVGVVARVLQVMKMPNGSLKVLVEGLVRARFSRLSRDRGYLVARVIPRLRRVPARTPELEALARTVNERFSEYVRLNRRIPDEVLVSVAAIDDYERLVDNISAHMLLDIRTKQRLLESGDVEAHFRRLARLLHREIEILKLELDIDTSTRESLSRSQREAFLQQQLKVIKAELGQSDESSGTDVLDLIERLEQGEYPEHVRLRADEEIERLSRMHPLSAEAGVVRSYVEWLLALPWKRRTEEQADFSEVQAVLDGDHFGLEKAKRRILEHLAVIRLAGRVRGPILCLVGPPGVGKTSIGRSVARALGRRFVRMSLGGIHDEAEIRGHRRTYIGAMPGRIIQCLKKAGSSNPVFLLDEVDKIGRDFRGDPSSALLEVLDPEQNSTFSDNYLELDYDLSDILFITTANSTATIPGPLLDRMEIIRLPGYLDFEKMHIARDFLLPKLRKELGLERLVIEFKQEALVELIRYYTREAGVRELERQMNAILRRTAVEIAGGKRRRRLTVTRAHVARVLGPRRFADTHLKTQPTVGYAVGLAWTEMGGDALPVEVVPMKGKGTLTLTGSLGDVMRESASAALSYVRRHARRFGLAEDFFDTLELHVHIPEGAVPKDGPSAGVTLLVAMLSSLTGIPVRTDLAMTGEITLTGDVLPVGGLTEKLLAAKRNNITEIVIPDRNRKDLVEMQPELLDGLTLHPVRTVREVIRMALVEEPVAATHRTRGGRRLSARVH